MKLKINKACDLNSISVLPPHTRRSSLAPSGPQSSQLRSQPSQQSFSQGISSQHALFSQISQNSLDEVVTADQRFGSQERENSAKKFFCLPPTNFTREDSQMPISRSSTNLIRKWNSASASEHRCQTSEELAHRLSIIETSLNRFGMILDSVLSDVMQVNKGTKEVLLEMEGIQQKLIAEETTLHLMNKGQEDIKASLYAGMKAISDQLNKDIYRDKLQQIFLVLSALPEQTEAPLLKLQNELSNAFTNEIKAIGCNVKTLSQKGPVATAILPKSTGYCATPQTKPEAVKKQAVPPKVYEQPTLPPKVEKGGWKPEAVKKQAVPPKVYEQPTLPPKVEKGGWKPEAVKKQAVPLKVYEQPTLPPKVEKGGWKPEAVKKQAVPPKVYEQPTLPPKVEKGGWKPEAVKKQAVPPKVYEQPTLPPKVEKGGWKPEAVKKQAVSPKVYEQPTLPPKVEKGGWKSVEMKQSTINERAPCKENRRKGVSSVEQETYRILIESDEEIDGGFSCLLDYKETDYTKNILIEEAKEETERILRKARRQKRKYHNAIIII